MNTMNDQMTGQQKSVRKQGNESSGMLESIIFIMFYCWDVNAF